MGAVVRLHSATHPGELWCNKTVQKSRKIHVTPLHLIEKLDLQICLFPQKSLRNLSPNPILWEISNRVHRTKPSNNNNFA